MLREEENEKSALLLVEDDDQDHTSCTGACAVAVRRVRRSRHTAVAIMFLAFMLDLMLLTVVGMLNADFLFARCSIAD